MGYFEDFVFWVQKWLHGRNKYLDVVIIGPPGSGKGTQAVRIAKQYDACHLSTGDMFRAIIASGTELGLKVKEMTDKGQLVPDDIVFELVEKRVDSPECKGGVVFDGFPRTLDQAKMLYKILGKRERKILCALDFKSDDTLLEKRLSGRLYHAASGRTYNEFFNPPKVPMTDDVTGERLVRRTDDHPDVVKKRLAQYKELSEPLIAYYISRHLRVRINSTKDPDSVFEDIRKRIQERRRGPQ